MESGTTGDAGNDLESRLRVRWNENCKVYTRRVNKKAAKISITNDSATSTANPPTSTSTTENPQSQVPSFAGGAATQVPFSTVAAAATTSTQSPASSVAQKPVKPAVNTSRTDIAGSPAATATENVETEQYLHQEKTYVENIATKRCSDQNGVQEGSGIQPADAHHLKINYLKDSSKKSGHAPVIGQLSSPQPSANDLPNGRETTTPQLASGYELQNDGEATSVPSPLPSGNEPDTVNGDVRPLVITRVDDRVRFNLSKATPRNEVRDLKKKLESELERVRVLFKQLEAKNAIANSSIISSDNDLTGVLGGNFGGYIQPQPQPQPQYVRNDSVENRMLVRVNSEMGSTGHLAPRPMGLPRVNSDVGATRYMEPRPYGRQLSVSVVENNHMVGEYTEKEKRTPKANQYYRNSEFLLGKDRLPPENHKRLKTNNKRKFGRHGYGFGFPVDKNLTQVFRSCNNLLLRLMRHKHSWVFNKPVNAQEMGLHDYHDIIKYPMDLGTIKNRLSQNWYKSPRDFAEDVRLVFRNAMTYNPKGQDVHVMAEILSEIFEESWAVIETEYNPYWKYQMYHDAGLPTPTSRNAPPLPHFAAPASASFPAHSAPQMMPMDRLESVAAPALLDPKIQRTHVGRMPVPKKPKAKDPHKRDMTYDEKQRLSKNLQGLPSEKLDAIVQIIKKRNTALCQNDNEIEVDIDAVDAETLWELDRFVTNFKKSLSKYKRKAELALQARAGANSAVPVTTTTPALSEVPVESGPGGKNPAPLSVQDGKQGYNGSRSSSSSSSSSDSGSSSSDSDSDSSSADGSDEGN